MRSYWSYFVIGVFAVIIATTVSRNLRAGPPEDARLKTLKDPELSSTKTPVPDAETLEAELVRREEELKERERRMKESEEKLALEESRIKDRIEQLETLLAVSEKKEQENQKVAKETLARLVKTFEAMSPKKAAGVMTVMPDEIAVEMILAMKEKRVASIMDAMDPNRAMTLSSLVARRRPASATGEKQAQ